mmetsp:Transcript_26156/g.62140  ORF Transcript_26156/g.62140 Transcript_26156/m.62140 type:complete len:597 (+) Transcript_26156:363-2153(+)
MIASLLLVFLVQASVTTVPGLLSHVPSFSAGIVGINNYDGFVASETMTAFIDLNEIFNDNLLGAASHFLPLGGMPAEVELPIVEEVEPLQLVQEPTTLGQLFSTAFVTIPTIVRARVDDAISSLRSAIHEVIDLSMSIPPDASEPLRRMNSNNNTNNNKKSNSSELLPQSSPTKGGTPVVLYWTGCHGFNNNNNNNNNNSTGLSPYELSTTVEMVPPTGNQTDSATFITMNSSSARPIGDHGSKSEPVVMYLTGHLHGRMEKQGPTAHDAAMVVLLLLNMMLVFGRSASAGQEDDTNTANAAAVKIQAAVRGHQQAVAYKAAQKAVIHAAAAVKIQAAARGHQQVVAYKATQKAVVKIQSVARDCIQRLEQQAFQEFVRLEQEKEEARRQAERDATHEDEDAQAEEEGIDNTLTMAMFDECCRTLGLSCLMYDPSSVSPASIRKIWKLLVKAKKKNDQLSDALASIQELNNAKDVLTDVLDAAKAHIYCARWRAAAGGDIHCSPQRVLGLVGPVTIESVQRQYQQAEVLVNAIDDPKDEDFETDHMKSVLFSYEIAKSSRDQLIAALNARFSANISQSTPQGGRRRRVVKARRPQN